jgi:hypothetical protein
MTEGEARILLETGMYREIAEEKSHHAMALLAELVPRPTLPLVRTVRG